jgi:hypothetical protein
MPTGYGPGLVVRKLLLLCTGLAAAAGPTATSDPSLEQILSQWQRQTSALRSIAVQFLAQRNDRNWGDKETFTGRVFVSRDGRCSFEVTQPAKQAIAAKTTRLIWANDALHLIVPEQKSHAVFPIGDKVRGRLPAPLALPFCWNTSIDRLKERYRIELVRREPKAWLLSFTPKTDAGKASFSRAYLWLDHVNSLPARFFVVSPDRTSTMDYRATETRTNGALAEDAPVIPGGEDWRDPFGESGVRYWSNKAGNNDLLP